MKRYSHLCGRLVRLLLENFHFSARGIVFLLAARQNLDISEYSPNTVKKNLVGYGHANKVQILKMIERIYPSVRINSDDSADALAVAICHAMQSKSKLNFCFV